MAAPSRASQAKRNRERSNQQKQQEKRQDRAARREERKVQKATRSDDGSEIDPDLIGIVAGPQPIIL